MLRKLTKDILEMSPQNFSREVFLTAGQFIESNAINLGQYNCWESIIVTLPKEVGNHFSLELLQFVVDCYLIPKFFLPVMLLLFDND